PLIKILAVDAVRITHERDGAVLEIREHRRSDGFVIGAQLALGVAVLRKEHLGAVRDVDLARRRDARSSLFLWWRGRRLQRVAAARAGRAVLRAPVVADAAGHRASAGARGLY